jgi:NTE family protein
MNTDKRNRKIGLALGSGSARGLAHIGVLEVLDREGIQVDCIAGTSAGALIGSIYACGLNGRRIREIAADLTLGNMMDIKPPKSGIIAGDKFRQFLAEITGDIGIEETAIPFACVATDITSGTERVLRKGSLVEAVRASISIPGLFRAVTWPDGACLVDGAVLNPLPVKVVQEMGAEVVIAVSVRPSRRHPGNGESPGMFEILSTTLEIASNHMLQHSLELADAVIAVDTRGFHQFDFNRLNELADLGAEAAENALPDIRRAIDGVDL